MVNQSIRLCTFNNYDLLCNNFNNQLGILYMSLRAKKAVIKENRFQAIVYATRGVGKTHFCASFPDAYYIDTEGLESYKHFTKMLVSNKSDIVRLNEMSEIIREVKELLSVRHNYKTLIIDSISFPFHLLANMEAERLSKAGSGRSEGTEFGANLAKAKRQVFELGMLITRLDMNVIITAHEKVRYQENVEIGKTADVNDKLEYSLGTVIHLIKMGDKVKAKIEKSRYPELKTNELIDFDDGFGTICTRLGDELFKRESKVEELATIDQIKEFDRLFKLMNYTDETRNKWIMHARASSLDQMSNENIKKCIDLMLTKLTGKQDKETE